MSERGFDASRYVVKLRGKEYLEVKWRLLWLRTQHPDASIETDLASHDLQRQMAIFKARVTIPGGGSATGWGQEEAADFGDYLEKAETKALGRALAALGFGTQFTEDFEFGAENERVVDSPVDRGSLRSTTGGTVRNGQSSGVNGSNGVAPLTAGGAQRAERPTLATVAAGVATGGRPEARPALPATEPQIKAIYAIGRGAQSMEEAEVDAHCQELFGVRPSELSRRQASEFIDALKAGAKG
ncbi:MAG: hypothetical protein ACRDJE_12330 [Dehalococcoidia bacterium]